MRTLSNGSKKLKESQEQMVIMMNTNNKLLEHILKIVQPLGMMQTGLPFNPGVMIMTILLKEDS